MKVYLASLAFLLTACGNDETVVKQAPNPVVPMQVAPGLEMHVQTFLEACLTAGVECPTDGLRVEWADTLPAGALGMCRVTKNTRHVRILLPTEKYVREELPLTVAHELGHCVLNLDHTESKEPHVMRATSFYSDERDQKPIQEWINEMFDGLEKK